MRFHLALDDEDERYLESTTNHLLNEDITSDLSPNHFPEAGIESLHSETEVVSQGLRREHLSSASDDSFPARKRSFEQIEEASPERSS